MRDDRESWTIAGKRSYCRSCRTDDEHRHHRVDDRQDQGQPGERMQHRDIAEPLLRAELEQREAENQPGGE